MEKRCKNCGKSVLTHSAIWLKCSANDWQTCYEPDLNTEGTIPSYYIHLKVTKMPYGWFDSWHFIKKENNEATS